MAGGQPKWEPCSHDSCDGVQLPATALCLAHTAEQAPDAFEVELRRIGTEGTVDARGVVISNEVLGRLMAAVPRKDDRPTFTAARFDGASFQEAWFTTAFFEGEVSFAGTSFEESAWFGGATFKHKVRFDQATFKDGAVFLRATFEGMAGFEGATFRELAGFGKATFKARADFRRAIIGEAQFDEVAFEREAWFRGATFRREVDFERATFEGVAGFGPVAFKGLARFPEAIFKGRAEFDGATFEDEAEFREATFEEWAGFDKATFKREVKFGQATLGVLAMFDLANFEGEAGFDRAIFGTAMFSRATFEGGARFGGATFEGEARFGEAAFKREVGFDGATFESWAGFGKTTFNRDATFEGATFKGDAGFDGSTFECKAEFDEASFHGEAGFGEATFKREARFDKATFERAGRIGPLVARKLFLDGVMFSENVEIDVTTAVLCARRAQFPMGGRLHLRWASVVLDDANLAAPSILAGVPPFAQLDEQDAARRWQRLPPGPRAERWRPRLISMRRADVAGLRVASVDLRACRFANAHNLDKLRIGGDSLFAHTSSWWRAHRKTLAEEQRWRASRLGRWRLGGWYPQVCQSPAYPAIEPPGALQPVQLAALYRDLRKGREDAKDEPGAADFYYGEMEMRRLDPGAPWAERLVLWLYWLTSGYALRAWRALTTLAVVVLLAAVLFAFWGFPRSEPAFRPVGIDRSGALVYQQQPAGPPPGLERLPGAVRFSARSATALFRGPDRALTPLGEWLEIGLRFIGPFLLGLAVLSVRGRVRR